MPLCDREVYKYEKIAKTEEMSAEKQRKYHQQNSKPVMEEIKEYLDFYHFQEAYP
jgi:hypothetical protein